jgi:hypothetical protein
MIVYDLYSKSTFLANAFDEPCRLWHLMALVSEVHRLMSKGQEAVLNQKVPRGHDSHDWPWRF